MNPVYAWTPYFRKIHFNISFRFTLGLSNDLIFSGFWTKLLSILPCSPHVVYEELYLVSLLLRISCLWTQSASETLCFVKYSGLIE